MSKSKCAIGTELNINASLKTLAHLQFQTRSKSKGHFTTTTLIQPNFFTPNFQSTKVQWKFYSGVIIITKVGGSFVVGLPYFIFTKVERCVPRVG